MGRTVSTTSDQVTLTEFTSSGKSYRIYIEKVDSENDSKTLAGAVFDVCDASDDSVLATGTTDATGYVTFQTQAGEGGLSWTRHTLYYLVETEAPEGYDLDETKYYFYLCDKEDSCSDCTEFEGTYRETYSDLTRMTTGYMFTVTNELTEYALPSTGGIGAVPYAAVGLALCGGAGWMLSRRRRRVHSR